jgi:hypothetical protein
MQELANGSTLSGVNEMQGKTRCMTKIFVAC